MTMHTEFLRQPTESIPTAGKVAIAGAVAALIGSFMAWASVASIFGSIDISGFKAGDGKLTAAGRSGRDTARNGVGEPVGFDGGDAR